MCGITGFWTDSWTQEKAERVLITMSRAIAHRGPDGAGVFFERGVGLGHRRLSILDISEEGAQPMTSRSGRYVMVYNGEVYNHLALRRDLKGPWRGTSDTETMLEAFEVWGIRAAVEKFVGMFACAIWDRENQELVLIRDRLGIKPLYWGFVQKSLVFGSELKALRQFPGFSNDINRDALAAFMRANCVPQPQCIYEGIHQMVPGTLLFVRGGKTRVETFWSVRDVARRGLGAPFSGGAEAAQEHLEGLLKDAIRMRLLSDVPLGAFLSGGVDSSLVVAMMQTQSAEPVRTFSIGFDDEAYDEAGHARAVAKHLGTIHTELIVRAEDALEVVPKLARLYDEPFADSSQIPTYLVSQLARKHVTVSLSGDGGDEVFGGYNRHIWGPRVWNAVKHLPPRVRETLSQSLRRLSAGQMDAAFGLLERLLPQQSSVRLPTEKLQKLAGVIPSENMADLYARLVTHWDASVVLGAETSQAPWVDFGEAAESMMLLDMETYLTDDILTKVDRASMAVSLEARVPLIDHRIVEFAWQLPLDLKIRPGAQPPGKWIFRQILYKHVPQKLIDRPKMGFGVPIDAWLRGPLRDWAEDLLDESKMRQQGFLDATRVQQRWREHQACYKNWQHHLWDVLMFQAWLEEYRN